MSHLLPTVCPHCGRKNELHRDPFNGPERSESPAPREGDLTLCIECVQWSQFGKGGALNGELDEGAKLYVATSPDAKAIERATRAVADKLFPKPATTVH